MNNVLDLLGVALEKEVEFLPFQESYIFFDAFAHKFDTFFVVAESLDHIDLLMYFLFEKSANLLFFCFIY